MANKNLKPPKDFEEAMRELEQIRDDFERGEMSLEQSLQKYERGQFLYQHCQGILNSAEKQIELITRGPNGALQTTPMSMPEAPPSSPGPSTEAADETAQEQ